MVALLQNPINRATVQFLVELYFSTSTVPSTTGTMSESSPSSTAAAVDPYKSSSFIGHSLWMVPSGDSKVAYSKLVGEMSAELGTFEFLPHITLVAAMMKGEDDAVQRTKDLASKLAPYAFEFEEISHRDAYFQCVYAKMKRTDAVVHANALAREFFSERQSDPDYMPHLSLVYGDFDEETKETEIIPKLKQIMASDENHSKPTMVIPVDAIEVWSTQGDVKEWYRVATISLTGKTSNSSLS